MRFLVILKNAPSTIASVMMPFQAVVAVASKTLKIFSLISVIFSATFLVAEAVNANVAAEMNPAVEPIFVM
ncbi:hypothetical protein D3C87_1783230 [compost metagenome]